MEAAEKKLAKRQDIKYVYVTTGPLYERTMDKLPNSSKSHKIPSAYWKIVAVKHGNVTKVAAFIMDQNTARAEDYCEKSVTVNDVEKRSSFNFFHRLSEGKQASLKASYGTALSMLGCSTE